MGLFGKPSLAQIYLKELRTQLDGTLVPVFAPDVNLAPGALGSFDSGQFVPANTTLAEEFGIELALQDPDTEGSDWVFASEGAVKLTASAEMSAGGVNLLTGKLSFTKNRSVVASFKGVTESAAVWSSAINRKVWELYLAERIPRDTVVVRAVRRAASGTVVIARKSGVNVGLAADPALLGGALSLQGLGAGVTFTGGTQASFQLSGPGLTPFIRVKGVGEAALEGLVDVKAFQDDPSSALAELDSLEVPDIDVEAALGRADWDEPEE